MLQRTRALVGATLRGDAIRAGSQSSISRHSLEPRSRAPEPVALKTQAPRLAWLEKRAPRRFVSSGVGIVILRNEVMDS
jgi:hypothetical protein